MNVAMSFLVLRRCMFFDSIFIFFYQLKKIYFDDKAYKDLLSYQIKGLIICLSMAFT